ncbi:hypothetical protein COV24_04860 [candidate division WWE3 bacterium CG10_big_fil_rev_8_21_14_0_10_32_10]|uniref:Sporulation stage II protein D amidase enhancer LytB N-terminal domain-containing protein n=1 Tax=candidate division WWE3 bacterium CG10_big_fil_rev_8_21_14_0_10_32_10 TaxID=1975090 RepID=A0A2H0RB37_UNCKA|nr:MAG: hypothetical protein COV24_04860 [candidate division WWE3 bacterium CG10_big_fil_rev_8_21_14_0_10_32_10]
MVSLIQSNAFLSDDNTSQYLKKYIDDSVQTISDINSEITINEKNKGRLLEIVDEIEAERVKLVAIKKDTEEKLAKQQEDLAAKNRDLSDLNKKLNGLLEKQQQILSAKNGDFSASLGEGVQTDDPNSAPDYNPGFSPAFAAFSYGAYTHYKGMSQYGAKGRAEEGKSYSDIIKFYYKEDVSKKDDFPSNICVEGYGDMDFQRYLYGLGEMPSTWPGDALKAQAVAARSYAYRYVKAGKCICTSQSCQVFIKSKSDNPPDAWKSAVDDTKNKIIGGSTDASGYGWYSSTSGGYIDNVGWDAKGSWPNDAYENRAKSPWFYKGWYTESYSKSSAKCGRDHPWLTEEEMADILNAYILLRAEKDTDRITPLTTSCWGGNPYSISELRSKADGVDTGYSKVKSVSVSYGNNGQTSQVTFETDKGTLKADGQLFKSAFNLRAPGYVAIKSRLYDIRRK